MSFEVFIQCFTGGAPDGVPAADIQRAFGGHLQTGDPKWWKVFYDEQNWSDILVRFLSPDRRLVSFMSVQRPCADTRLWDALFSILRLGHCVLYFPAEKPPLLVADDSVAEHLPKDMVGSMGKVTRVSGGEDICAEIRKV
jgi:hypothetical protein